MNEHQDFDVTALAQYLHLSPAQVQRMADRGKLPGRKIGGQWRFSQADIHHWFETQIGASDSQELIDVEGVLQRQQTAPADQVRIADLLPVELIAIPLDARTKNSAIDSICQLAANFGKLWDAAGLADAIRNRESLHPTALESGVALLHPRRPIPSAISDSFLALGITSKGIPFGGPRGTLTDIFFLIASYDDAIHLRILARLSRLIMEPGVLEALRTAANANEAWEIIAMVERKIP
jgi:PTS system nitrogen regulatory IIA component